ncbi:MAG: elongation factor G [Candidatus Krumholzibacteriales bacterium]
MKQYNIEDLRNVVFVGHQSSGKTSLCEAILFNTGIINRMGSVENGNTVMDSDPEEKERNISVSMSIAAIEKDGKKINLIDTPGYADFIGQMLSGISVAESGVIVIPADGGIEAGSEVANSYLRDKGAPRFVCVNKMDKEHADFDKCVQEAQNVLGKEVMPLILPAGSGAQFRGVVNILENKAYIYSEGGKFSEEEVPSELEDKVNSIREELRDFAAESDDSLLEKYLETGELSGEELVRGLSAGCRQGTLVPLVVTSAAENVGVQQLVDMMINMFPSPAYFEEVKVLKGGEETAVSIDPDSTPLAFVFKSYSEKNVGKLSYLKVLSGRITSGMDMFNSTAETSVRIGQLYYAMGSEKIETDEISTGDIGVAVKLKEARVNDTLCDKDNPVQIPEIEYPEPSIRTGIVPRDESNMDKVGIGLNKLAEEDPSFTVEISQQLNQTILSGQGELHFNVILSRLKDRQGVEVDMVEPGVEYLETITSTSQAQGKHKKQSGGRGQYGDVWIKLEPQPRGEGFEFVNEIVGGVVPSKFVPAVEKGIVEAMQKGVIAGYRMVDVRATLYDGTHHSVDSSEAAFKAAGSKGFKAAVKDAKPVLLEPIMEVTVRVPENYMGDVMGDLSMRRGKIQGTEQDNTMQIIKAQVPLAELYRYSTSLRSMTQGRASHTRVFSHYEIVPHEQAQKLIARANIDEEESD